MFAERAVLDAFHHLDVAGLVATLQSHSDLEVLLFRFLCSFQHAAHTWSIHCHGLFHEDVLSLLHRLLEHHGTEDAGRCENHDITRGDSLLVRFEPHETPFLGHINLPGVLGLEVLHRNVSAVLIQLAMATSLRPL
jgi:hypothetical protein